MKGGFVHHFRAATIGVDKHPMAEHRPRKGPVSCSGYFRCGGAYQQFGYPRSVFIGQQRPRGQHLFDVAVDHCGAKIAAGPIYRGVIGSAPSC